MWTPVALCALSLCIALCGGHPIPPHNLADEVFPLSAAAQPARSGCSTVFVDLPRVNGNEDVAMPPVREAVFHADTVSFNIHHNAEQTKRERGILNAVEGLAGYWQGIIIGLFSLP